MSTQTALPAGARIGSVALRVSDLETQCAFYRDVVGLTVLERAGDRAVMGTGDEPALELLAEPDAPERTADETGLFHTAFLVPSRGALGDALERVRSEWRLSGAADHVASEALYCSDPEGNGVEIYRDRPADAWERTDDGGVRLDTLPLELEDLASDALGEEAAPAGTTVGHVHLEVSSLSAARRFYVDGLGFGVQFASEGALFVAAGDYHHHVGLNTWNGRTAPASDRTLGLERVELVVPDRGTLVGVEERLAEQGVALDGGDSEGDSEGEGERNRSLERSVRDPDEIEWRLSVRD